MHGLGSPNLGPIRIVLGLDRSYLAANNREEWFPERRGAVMTAMWLGKEFLPNIGLGKENFGLGLQDLQKLE